MAGYANRTLHLDFSDLGEGCYVEIRNPKLLPQTFFDGNSDPRLAQKDGETAQETTVRLNSDPTTAALLATSSHGMYAKLVVGWRVWDVDDMSDDPAELPLPTAEDTASIGKLPIDILKRLSEEVSSALSPT
jgi:hypothetical protein